MADETGAKLAALRKLMQNEKYVTEPLHAYIIPTDDAHQVRSDFTVHGARLFVEKLPTRHDSLTLQSEYIAECDKRRVFISGFTGSAGKILFIGYMHVATNNALL